MRVAMKMILLMLFVCLTTNLLAQPMPSKASQSSSKPLDAKSTDAKVKVADVGTQAIQAIQVGKITKLFVLNSPIGGDDAQRVIVRLEEDVPNGLCSKKDFWQLLLKNEAERAQYALLLASYMNDKKVKIWGNPDAHCIHKGERIRNVEIAP